MRRCQGPPRPPGVADPFEFHETLAGDAESKLDALLLRARTISSLEKEPSMRVSMRACSRVS